MLYLLLAKSPCLIPHSRVNWPARVTVLTGGDFDVAALNIDSINESLYGRLLYGTWYHFEEGQWPGLNLKCVVPAVITPLGVVQ